MAAPLEREGDVWSGANAVIVRPGKIDRSPTGTGCSARMAVLHARGILEVGDRFIGRSIIGSASIAVSRPRPRSATAPASYPRSRDAPGSPARRQLMRDPADPWPEGYRLSDTWPRLEG